MFDLRDTFEVGGVWAEAGGGGEEEEEAEGGGEWEGQGDGVSLSRSSVDYLGGRLWVLNTPTIGSQNAYGRNEMIWIYVHELVSYCDRLHFSSF